jgi:pyruvate/2-oxoglutarate dehydrogenase complex dihydrolipoamide dehydrogenase (E3) component
VTAAGATYLGARAALVERAALGGDCLWTGCVPSKALIASARAAHIRRDSGMLGLFGKAVPPDFASVMSSMRQAREIVSHHDDPERFRQMGVEVAFGQGEFTAADTVRVGDRTLHARRIVIATGSRPSVPSIPGLEEAGYLTHENVFDLESSPGSVALIGGGPIGVEFAQVFSRLNVPVTVLELASNILPREDPDAALVIRQALEREGVAVETGVTIVRVETTDGRRTVVWRRGTGPEERTTGGAIFVAAGRSPNTDGLGLERAGVETDHGVVVDRHLRSTRPGIWAAGDVSGGLQFTHVAEYQAKLVLRNALTPFPARADYAAVPWVIYSDPELARVGRTEEDAREAGLGPIVYRYDLNDLDRAITERRPEGFVKLVATRRGRILGATIVGLGAGELIAPVVLAMRRGLRISALSDFVYPYPTMSEGVKRAADLSQRARLDSFGGRMLKRLIRWRL